MRPQNKNQDLRSKSISSYKNGKWKFKSIVNNFAECFCVSFALYRVCVSWFALVNNLKVIVFVLVMGNSHIPTEM